MYAKQLKENINVLDHLAYKDFFMVTCSYCHNTFSKNVREIKRGLMPSQDIKDFFCCKEHKALSMDRKATLNCLQCNKQVTKKLSELKKVKNVFCNNSCAALYNNTHKTKGTRTSKLETYLQTQLSEIYKELEFHFGRKDTINSELDIYIPSLKLAFELNGVFHYEPIYGEQKLKQIQNNDNRKFQACLERQIELCIINTTSQQRFTIQSSQRFLEIVTSIINNKLVPREGFQPSNQ